MLDETAVLCSTTASHELLSLTVTKGPYKIYGPVQFENLSHKKSLLSV